MLQVAVSADAAPGVRDLRLETPVGLTNPLVFEIGHLAEVVNKPVDPRRRAAARSLETAPRPRARFGRGRSRWSTSSCRR